MFLKILNHKAFSVIEYALLFVIIILALSVMRNYIQRGVFGLWGQSGQSFSYGRQYDAQRSIQCGFDEVSNVWYDRSCFESNKNLTGCNNVPAAYCGDGSACSSGLCANGSLCGEPSCEESIMFGSCQTASCGQMD